MAGGLKDASLLAASATGHVTEVDGVPQPEDGNMLAFPLESTEGGAPAVVADREGRAHVLGLRRVGPPGQAEARARPLEAFVGSSGAAPACS